MTEIYTASGNRKQSSVYDAELYKRIMDKTPPLRFGVVENVYTGDNQLNLPGISSGSQGYITYDVKIAPQGIVIKQVPAMSTGGHIINIDTPNGPPMSQQNTEEYPFVIGQPVLEGFINESNFIP